MGIMYIHITQQKSFLRWVFKNPLYTIMTESQLSEELDEMFEWLANNFEEPCPFQIRWQNYSKRWTALSRNCSASIFIYNDSDITLFKLRWLDEIGKNIL